MSEKVIKRMRRLANLASGNDWERRYKAFKKSPGQFYGSEIADVMKGYRRGAIAEQNRQSEIRSLILKSRGRQ